jgi:hypothetical protein
MNKKEQKQTKTGLTPLQEKVATLLATGESISSIAEKLDLNRGTIYQWQQKLAFQCYFNFQRLQAKETLQNGLYGLYSNALDTIKECLNSENEAIKFKTATFIIQKVEECSLEDVDIYEAIKKKATKKLFPDIEESQMFLDKSEYNRLIKENGLK